MFRADMRAVREEQWPPNNTLRAVVPQSEQLLTVEAPLVPFSQSGRRLAWQYFTCSRRHKPFISAACLTVGQERAELPFTAAVLASVGCCGDALQQNGCNNGAGDDRLGKARGGERGRALWSRRGGVGVGMECEWPKYNLGQRQVVSKVQGNKNSQTKHTFIALAEKLKWSFG